MNLQTASSGDDEETSMSPNPTAVRIARETGRSYDEVRRALNLLEFRGWNYADAEKLIKRVPRSGSLDVAVQRVSAVGLGAESA